ncbi:hypothetical protein [Nonomuraea typhae]|uniref:hypothetical protein n=1 Tax=Nonomuraea typhae TaxID=2603600 RepID=UPI001CA5090A|nr:hypothetical protein [Nonomuraea typhae]
MTLHNAVPIAATTAGLIREYPTAPGTLPLPGPAQTIAAVAAGFDIGVVAVIMGVAGG